MDFTYGIELKGSMSGEQREEFEPFSSALPYEKSIRKYHVQDRSPKDTTAGYGGSPAFKLIFQDYITHPRI